MRTCTADKTQFSLHGKPQHSNGTGESSVLKRCTTFTSATHQSWRDGSSLLWKTPHLVVPCVYDWQHSWYRYAASCSAKIHRWGSNSGTFCTSGRVTLRRSILPVLHSLPRTALSRCSPAKPSLTSPGTMHPLPELPMLVTDRGGSIGSAERSRSSFRHHNCGEGLKD